jgi:hypothetical protein
LLAIVWLTLVGIAGRFVLAVHKVTVSALRRVRAEMVVGSTRGMLQVSLTFALGLVAAIKSQSQPAPAVPVPELDIQTPPSRLAMQRGTPALLPALASAGLAVGLGKHVQRERAALLRDAPVKSRLRRPSAAALARGTVVFERSRTAQATLPTDAASEAMIVPLGVADERLVHLAIRAGDTVSIDAERIEALCVLRHILNTVSLAPWLTTARIVLCGFAPDDVVIAGEMTFTGSPVEAVAAATALRQGTTPQETPTVLVVAASYAPEFDVLSDAGITVIAAAIAASKAATRVARERFAWRVSTTDEIFLPYGVSAAEADDFRTMLREMTTLEPDDSPALAVGSDWSVLARVLGPVEVCTRDSTEIPFRKSKSVELLCWLSVHRERPTVSAARTALWEVDVEDATFHNVLSELRRGLAAAGRTDAAGRVNKQRLFLDSQVVTDAELLRRALQRVESQESCETVGELLSLLGMVRGLPFADAGYAWADAEGITSTFVWLVTRAVEQVCALADESADESANASAVMQATNAGLRMSPADDHFLALRRRTERALR